MDTIVYLSGTRWSSLPGTDKMLARSLARHNRVLWIDHPVPIHSYKDVREHFGRSLLGIPEAVAPGIARLRLPALPGVGKPVSRSATEILASRCVESALARTEGRIAGVVNSSPILRFPAHTGGGIRLLHLTDDWLAGAKLMGFAPIYLRRVLQANIESADVISAVSEDLASKISHSSGRPIEVVPNGCSTSTLALGLRRRQVVALVGQLNERLDLDVLESVVASDVAMLVIGPRADGDPVAGSRLDALLSRPNVDWRGPMPQEEVQRLLQTVSVGITPYADTEFNRSSFPLKTLEYLSAGLQVVATDLPSARWIGSSAVSIAANPSDFARQVTDSLRQPVTAARRQEIAATVLKHSWDTRADCIEKLLSAKREAASATHGSSTPLMFETGRVMSATEPNPNVDHVLLTRFNLPSKGFESIVRAKDGWLRNRIQLFETYCLPSVIAQSQKNFHWIIYLDPQSPAWLVQRIGELSVGGRFHPIYREEVDALDLLKDIRDVTGQSAKHLLTTNLDNDDGLSSDFVARVQAIEAPELPSVVFFTAGLVKCNNSLFLRTDRRNAFCSVLSDWNEPTTCWSSWHDQIGKTMPSIRVEGTPGWLQVVHGLNVSNRTRGRLVSPTKFIHAFPGLMLDVQEPDRFMLFHDFIIGRPRRILREACRAALKSVTIALLGRSGIDRVKVVAACIRREVGKCN